MPDTILITGGNSFLGRNLLQRLTHNDYKLYATSQHIDTAFNIHPLDLLNIEEVKKTIHTIKPSIIYHLAANVDLSRDYEVGKLCIDVNIQGTLNLLEAAKLHSPTKFIYTSTEEIYGNNQIPFTENQLPDPPSIYSITKLAGEKLCEIYGRDGNFQVWIFRIGTMYGPGQKSNRLIAQIIAKALQNEPILLNSGMKKRDYIFVEDAVDALVAVLKSPEHSSRETINIGGGTTYSLIELVQHILDLSKSKSQMKVGMLAERSGEAQEWLLNIEKAKQKLNWEPRTPLKKGVKITLQSLKNSIK